ncbi:hypothetical protein D3C78_1327990 [compost metagenome]
MWRNVNTNINRDPFRQFTNNGERQLCPDLSFAINDGRRPLAQRNKMTIGFHPDDGRILYFIHPVHISFYKTAVIKDHRVYTLSRIMESNALFPK